MAAFMTAMGIAAPLGLKALAVIAGKALVISKVALTIAGIIVLKKLFTHDHHEETNIEVKEHNRRHAHMNYYRSPVARHQMVGTAAAAANSGATMDPYSHYYSSSSHQAARH